MAQTLAQETTVLLVKKLPDLDPLAVTEFFRRFGASDVRPMSPKGRMRNCAFVSFPDRGAASLAFSRLQTLDLSGHKLRVEFARPSECAADAANKASAAAKKYKVKPRLQHASVPIVGPLLHSGSPNVGRPNPPKTPVHPEQSPVGVPQQFTKPVPIAPRLWIDYPAPPTLYYDYPAPTTSILTNIGHAIAAVPKLYVQVLHLMNKMNLPPPFDAPTPATAIVRVSSRYRKRKHDELLSSDESEWDSGDEAATILPRRVAGTSYLNAPLGLTSAPQRRSDWQAAAPANMLKKQQRKEERVRVDAATKAGHLFSKRAALTSQR